MLLRGITKLSLNNFKDGDNSKEYELPDGKSILITEEMFKAPEVMFQPGVSSLGLKGYQHYIKDTIDHLESEIQEVMLSNIILTGGNTMFDGFGHRLWHELNQLDFTAPKIKILAPPDRNHTVWRGGSILAALSTFQTMWITKAEYEDCGPTIIHRKCI